MPAIEFGAISGVAVFAVSGVASLAYRLGAMNGKTKSLETQILELREDLNRTMDVIQQRLGSIEENLRDDRPPRQS